MICANCEMEYTKQERQGKPGRLTICNECANEEGDIQKYTGNMIFSHKTAATIQINKDPSLTQFINGKRQSGTEHKSGSVVVEAETFNYKNRES